MNFRSGNKKWFGDQCIASYITGAVLSVDGGYVIC
ncbi:MAG: SDR family oxidoreductase [Anaerolineaceae bacterium]|nr:SDR family oxidoreductase [Anaerolineaceae bacterium]